jgi:hypothetical protein
MGIGRNNIDRVRNGVHGKTSRAPAVAAGMVHLTIVWYVHCRFPLHAELKEFTVDAGSAP